MSSPCRRTAFPEPPGCGLDPATDLIETLSVIVAKLYDLADLGLMPGMFEEDDARVRHLHNLLCVQMDSLEQAQTLLDRWEPPPPETPTVQRPDAAGSPGESLIAQALRHVPQAGGTVTWLDGTTVRIAWPRDDRCRREHMRGGPEQRSDPP